MGPRGPAQRDGEGWFQEPSEPHSRLGAWVAAVDPRVPAACALPLLLLTSSSRFEGRGQYANRSEVFSLTLSSSSSS
jgi:hypothetical protein